ncbi:hypothetical protein [Simkania sp.]|uniref:hypothetical protein n=1 Tax=Simkania sp. TaxID=34094 RepID=UPI003B51DB2E
MACYETPRPGSLEFRREVYGVVLDETLEQQIGLEESYFYDLDDYKKQQVITSLYRAIKENQHSFTDLDHDDQYEILIYLFTYQEEVLSISLETSTAQDFFKPLISSLPLRKEQKIQIALEIMISHGKDAVNQCDFLTYSERVEASTLFQDTVVCHVFPNVTFPSEIDEIRELAFRCFSGPKRVLTSLHHYVLVGLLYANEPDIEAIRYVAHKYLDTQRKHLRIMDFPASSVGKKTLVLRLSTHVIDQASVQLQFCIPEAFTRANTFC